MAVASYTEELFGVMDQVTKECSGKTFTEHGCMDKAKENLPKCIRFFLALMYRRDADQDYITRHISDPNYDYKELAVDYRVDNLAQRVDSVISEMISLVMEHWQMTFMQKYPDLFPPEPDDRTDEEKEDEGKWEEEQEQMIRELQEAVAKAEGRG